MKERRVHRTWGERFFLEPLFYWLDLYGADGRPSHSKVLSAWGFYFALGFEAWWATQAEALSWPFVWLVVATLSIPMGKDVFSKVFGIRMNGGGARTWGHPPAPPPPSTQEQELG